MTGGAKFERTPILPDRVRKIEGGFAFIPHRFLHQGYLAALAPGEIELYFFLVVAGDRQGVSYYQYDRICSVLQMDLESYIAARNGLIDADLIAFDGTRFQVLSLPERVAVKTCPPLPTAAELADKDPATIRSQLEACLCVPDDT